MCIENSGSSNTACAQEMVIAGTNSYQGNPFGELLSESRFPSSEKLDAESQQLLEKEAKNLGRDVRVHSGPSWGCKCECPLHHDQSFWWPSELPYPREMVQNTPHLAKIQKCLVSGNHVQLSSPSHSEMEIIIFWAFIFPLDWKTAARTILGVQCFLLRHIVG